jgi:hypothetical protein
MSTPPPAAQCRQRAEAKQTDADGGSDRSAGPAGYSREGAADTEIEAASVVQARDELAAI